MAEQIPGNLTGTTVAAGGYTLGSGLLNVASTASPFPASGTFSVVVYDQASPPVPRGILRVSAVNSATQFAVTAEGADFNANAGDRVYAVISTVALTALLAAAGPTVYNQIIEDEGSSLTQRSTVNFAGAGVTAADAGGKTVVTIPGAGSAYATVQDEGTPLTQRTTMNFAGSGVTATDSGGVTLVTIPGSAGSGYDTVQDEGTPLTQRSTMNFVGAGVTAADSGGVTTITIPGGGGSSGLASGAAFTPINNPNSSVANWQNFSILTCIRGLALHQYPTSWKVRMMFTAGSPVIGAMKILRTLWHSTTVIDSTNVQIGGNSAPTLTTPSLVDTDAISLTLDNTHDYWFVLFFANDAANASVGVASNGTATPASAQNIVALPNGFVAGDQSGVGTIPALTGGVGNAPYLVIAGIIP